MKIVKTYQQIAQKCAIKLGKKWDFANSHVFYPPTGGGGSGFHWKSPEGGLPGEGGGGKGAGGCFFSRRKAPYRQKKAPFRWKRFFSRYTQIGFKNASQIASPPQERGFFKFFPLCKLPPLEKLSRGKLFALSQSETCEAPLPWKKSHIFDENACVPPGWDKEGC